MIDTSPQHMHQPALRRMVLIVAVLKFAYFGVEFAIARAIGFADSIDFLEDTSVNLLIFLGLAWSERARAGLGMVLALVLPGPSSTIRCRLRQSCLYSPASARWWSTSPARCSLQNSAITAAV